MKTVKWASVLSVILCICAFSSCGRSVSSADKEGITKACLDYFEGYCESNADRIKKGTHTQFTKRLVEGNIFTEMNLDQYIALSQRRLRPKPPVKIIIHDVYRTVATATIESSAIELALLAKINGEWKVSDIVWDYTNQVEK